jgi:hypothetical protein
MQSKLTACVVRKITNKYMHTNALHAMAVHFLTVNCLPKIPESFPNDSYAHIMQMLLSSPRVTQQITIAPRR